MALPSSKKVGERGRARGRVHVCVCMCVCVCVCVCVCPSLSLPVCLPPLFLIVHCCMVAGGVQHKSIAWRHNSKMFAAWQEGRTGFPFVDANMRELAATGFMSNRGRQNVASFLTKVTALQTDKGEGGKANNIEVWKGVERERERKGRR